MVGNINYGESTTASRGFPKRRGVSSKVLNDVRCVLNEEEERKPMKQAHTNRKRSP